MPNHIAEAPIGSVLPNPHRDFTNYPIDEVQVARLMASFEDTGGIWHALPARRHEKVAYGGWTYQLCFGHHRVEAARRLGYETVRLEVGDHDDDEMNLMLAVENGTQRVNNAAASLDSVAAITRRLAYFLLRAESLEHLSAIAETWAKRLFDSQKAFEVARGNLLNGRGIGVPLILKYAPTGTLERREVDSAIATLKDSGGYQRILETVTTRVKAELDAEEAEREVLAKAAREKAEREAEADRKRAEAAEAREKAEREREEKAQAKAEADREAAEARRKAAEAKREQAAAAKAEREREAAAKAEKAAADRLEKLAAEKAAREEAAAERAKQREAAEAERKRKQAEHEKREAETAALVVKAAKMDPLLDVRVVPLFRNHYALGRFRELVTDPSNRHYFPVADQLHHAQEICRLFEEQNRKSAAENLTANYVASYLNAFIAENLRGKREDERRVRSLSENFAAELAKAMKGANWIMGAVVEMTRLLGQGANVPDDFEEQLRALEERSAGQIAELRKATGYVAGGREITGRAVAANERPLAISPR